MERIGSIMYLKPGNQGAYQRRHAALWPEMTAALKAHGASHYAIFLNPLSDELFAYLEVPDKARYQQIAETAICQKWWAYMAPLMKCHEDNRPVTLDLDEVFYLP